jgi:serine/threonine protein kinase
MSGDNKNKGDESEKRDQADFPTLSLPGSGELSDSPTALLGTRIGSYKLVSVLGEGGFGIVYRAEQEEPVRRDVALKIIKPGMDSIQVIGRFEAERQTLAWLDHPNIAHIYDGGTTEAGRPYFVMEYVEGTPITEYCDEQKLSVKERLELFEQVCKAAQHAHQKGITHRDIINQYQRLSILV